MDERSYAMNEAKAAFNRGVLHARAGDVSAALDEYAAAARAQPGWEAPWEARGHLLFGRGDYADAAAAFEAAIKRAPTAVNAYANLALCQQRLRQWSRAVAPLQRARELAPDDPAIWWLARGNLLLLRRDEEALADFLRFAPLAKPSARLVVTALGAARRLGDPRAEAPALEAALAYPYTPDDASTVAELLALVQYFDIAPADLLALYATYDRLQKANTGSTPQLPARQRGALAGDARLRIGYLSADFRRHVMGELLAPVFAAHDRSRFAIHLYSLAPPGNADAVTAALRAHADTFTDLASLDDATAARTIADAGLDLLVDLMGHSAFARPGILARRPARAQATHLGYHGALGLRAVDWKITDAIADTPESVRFQLESPLPLSVCVLPLRPYAAPGTRWSRAEMDLLPGAVVAAVFVGVQKLSPRGLALWRRWLEAVQGGVLLFSPPRDDDRAALLRRCAGFGIDTARLRFVRHSDGDPPARAARYALADLALDTVPYTGGDTTACALAAGIPVVTQKGARHAERMSASILAHAGLPELVAGSDDAYVELAVRVAIDRPWRDHLRARVRSALSRPGLSDPAVYARALEAAYTRALDEHGPDPS